jgi:hypothetical protein
VLLPICGAAVLSFSAHTLVPQASQGLIHFTFHPISFSLDSCETPERRAPETLAGHAAKESFLRRLTKAKL